MARKYLPMLIRAVHILIAATCGLLLCAYRGASAAPLGVDQFYHTQWRIQDGAPPGIETLVQTADGYLWMANGSGLFRFDGVHFERISRVDGQELLSNNISMLWASKRGLWIGYRFGGASYLEGERLAHYTRAQGLPVSTTKWFAEDGTGSMWIGTTVGLFQLTDGKFSRPGNGWALPPGRINALMTDAGGTMWLVVGNGCVFLRRGTHRFEACRRAVPSPQGTNYLVSRNGAAWLAAQPTLDEVVLESASDDARIVIKVHSTSDAREFPISEFSLFRFDREGQFWLAGEQGARRLSLLPGATASGPARGHFGQPREISLAEANGGKLLPLTGRFVAAMVEDREGSIWFSTSGGLDRLRVPALSRAELPSGFMSYAMAAATDDGVWIGANSDQMYRITGDAQHALVRGGPKGVYSCFYVDPRGDLWVGLTNQIWRLHQGRWTTSKRPIEQGSSEIPGDIQSMAMDSTGAMWVSVVRVGVFEVVGDEWTLWGGRTDLPAEPATFIASDERGRVWFGYADGKIVLLGKDRLATFSSEHGLASGTVFSIVPRGDITWIGGERGLFYFDGRTFHPVRRAEGAFASVSGVVELANGDVWLNTGDGAVRISRAEIRKVLNDPSQAVEHTLFNYLDGMPGVPLVIRPLPTVVADKQQRLWFATSDGVAWTHAEPRTRNKIIPTVLVKSIRADDRVFDFSSSPVQLPARTRNLEIAYTALSLAIPERVRFKYRLDGNDTEWQDVGARREAFFTDLPPGKYRFHVSASNNDGLWNETGAVLEFVIPPTFVQTPWFTALCVGTLLALIWLVFAIRLRQAKAQLRWRLEERLVERERIARELHDTFLQGVQGLMLRFQSATERIPKNEPARALMEVALDRADQVLADGRDKVSNLRSSPQSATGLPQALSVLGSELAQDYPATFDLSVEGTERELHQVIREEAFRIGAEALANAFRHAQATRIHVAISYTRRLLVLLVRDNGRGFNTDRLQIPAGHWGLKGMEERAARIRASLTLSSSTSEGTSVELKVPARMAFKSGRSVPRIK